MKRVIAAIGVACLMLAATAQAAPMGGGRFGGFGGGGARAAGVANVHRPEGGDLGGRGADWGGRGGDFNRGGDGVGNHNVNINGNNINIDHDYHGDWGDDWDHPFATAAAVTAGVALTSAVIGSIVYSLPAGCMVNYVNGIAYQTCGNVWYQPQYSGTNVQYIVVNPPN